MRARLRFTNVDLEGDVELGTTILDAARALGAPEGSHCGGVCACSKCHVYVEAGGVHLSPMAMDERDMLELAAEDLRDESRLGCQAIVTSAGTIEVRISEESFQQYLDANAGERARAMELWERGNRTQD